MSAQDAEKIWLPDGHGLPDEALALHAEHRARVHLRLTSPDRRSARSACDSGLGELWTGKPDEVTCPACLVEAAHSRQTWEWGTQGGPMTGVVYHLGERLISPETRQGGASA